MTRLVRRPIRITDWHAELPRTFLEEDAQTHIVASYIDHWSETGAWWRGELQKQICVVLTTEQRVFEIVGHDDIWYIQRIWD